MTTLQELRVMQVENLTYDDVLLLPRKSNVTPAEVQVQTKLTKSIPLNIPLISAAMDTVSESDVAIALARQGGIAFIHKSMSIEQQASEVEKVKRSEGDRITEPYIAKADDNLGKIIRLMQEQKVGGIPVIDHEKRPVGILTNRDVRDFATTSDKKVRDVMTPKDELLTASETIDKAEAKELLKQSKMEKLPLVDGNLRLTGLMTYKDITEFREYPKASKDDYGRLLVGAAVGVGPETLDRVNSLREAGVDVIAIDVAHGHTEKVLSLMREIKETFPDQQLVVGNVSTKEAAYDLASAGADAVKIGNGPGSICTTRIVSGVGRPQLSAIFDVVEGLSEDFPDIPVIADGGIKEPGDITKALAAGASTIMSGSLFAGTAQAPGKVVHYDGKKFKEYRGMGSEEAMTAGSSDRYHQDQSQDLEAYMQEIVPEGVAGLVPYKGTLEEQTNRLIGGLRAGMGYTGSKDFKDLTTATFIKETIAGKAESQTHGVFVTQEEHTQ